ERLAFAPGRPVKARLWPLYRLVEVGDPAAQRHAVHRLVETVICTTDTAALAYAVGLLATLGLHGEAQKGLLLRAAWRWHDTQTRVEALDLFQTVCYDSPSVNDDDGFSLVTRLSVTRLRDGPDDRYYRRLSIAAEIGWDHV